MSDVRLIPKNMEQYTAVMTQKFKFVDSFQHLQKSLKELTENLKLELLLTKGQPSTTLVFAFFTVSLFQVLCVERHPGEGGGAHSGKLKNRSYI